MPSDIAEKNWSVPAAALIQPRGAAGFYVGLRSDSDLGAIEVAFTVDGEKLSFVVTAPVVGRLSALFQLLPDGTAQFGACMRNGVAAKGPPPAERRQPAIVEGTASNDAEVSALRAELHQERTRAKLALNEANAGRTQLESEVERLRSKNDALTSEIETLRTGLAEATPLAARLPEVEAALALEKNAHAETRDELGTVQARLTASRAANEAQQKEAAKSAGELEASLESARAELGTAMQTIGTVQAELAETTAERERLKAELKQAEQNLSTSRTANQALSSELRHVRDEKSQVEGVLDTAQARAEQLDAQVIALTTKLHESESLVAEAAQRESALNAKLEESQAEIQKLGAALKQEQEVSAARQAELEEEQRRRDEMVADLAYIQTQVADLSSTKGALVDRINSMSNREVKRAKSTAQMTDLLRTAEVVAADKITSLRRVQAHAQKLEEQVSELLYEKESLQKQVVEGEQARDQLAKLTAERDALKVQITFFQKQIGAMQREKQPPKQPVAATPAPAPPRQPPVLTPRPVKAAELPAEWSEFEPTAPGNGGDGK